MTVPLLLSVVVFYDSNHDHDHNTRGPARARATPQRSAVAERRVELALGLARLAVAVARRPPVAVVATDRTATGWVLVARRRGVVR